MTPHGGVVGMPPVTRGSCDVIPPLQEVRAASVGGGGGEAEEPLRGDEERGAGAREGERQEGVHPTLHSSTSNKWCISCTTNYYTQAVYLY